jgi:hypothetical protein
MGRICGREWVYASAAGGWAAVGRAAVGRAAGGRADGRAVARDSKFFLRLECCPSALDGGRQRSMAAVSARCRPSAFDVAPSGLDLGRQGSMFVVERSMYFVGPGGFSRAVRWIASALDLTHQLSTGILSARPESSALRRDSQRSAGITSAPPESPALDRSRLRSMFSPGSPTSFV